MATIRMAVAQSRRREFLRRHRDQANQDQFRLAYIIAIAKFAQP